MASLSRSPEGYWVLVQLLNWNMWYHHIIEPTWIRCWWFYWCQPKILCVGCGFPCLMVQIHWFLHHVLHFQNDDENLQIDILFMNQFAIHGHQWNIPHRSTMVFVLINMICQIYTAWYGKMFISVLGCVLPKYRRQHLCQRSDSPRSASTMSKALASIDGGERRYVPFVAVCNYHFKKSKSLPNPWVHYFRA